MIDRTQLKNLYADRAGKFLDDVRTYSSKVRNTNIMRGVSFVAGAAMSIVAASYSITIMWTIIAISLFFFVYFVRKNYHFQNMLTYSQTMLKINQDELKAMGNDFSSFDGGNNFIDKNHNFTYDLDIFGERSIFQMINRTVTSGGRELLAHKLSNPSTSIREITDIQDESKPLADELEIRQDFIARGLIHSSGDEGKINHQINNKNYQFTESCLWITTAIALTAITLSSIALSIAGIVSPYIPLALYLIQTAITTLKNSQTGKLASLIEKSGKTFQKYSKLFQAIEKLGVRTKKHNSLKDINVSNALQDLATIAGMYEQRNNMAVRLLLQGLICYDIFLNIRFEKWLRKYSGETEKWLEIVHEYDFLFSIATLKFNNPDYHYPTLVDTPFIMEASEAGHPLIDPEKCVKNNIKFSNCNFLTILTGANMAGKSTYLRTIGTNMVLAQIGAVVNAQKMTLAPAKIMTSIRTNDSVQDSESYFFAELKRLRKIVDRLESGETIFIIVDEMLRGTNSKDKHDGSQKFIEKLLKYNCYGIFATHDIDIGNMQESYPKNVNAKCFEISFEGDNLIFDYKIKDGISKNLNASFLMRKMGIIE